MDAQGQKDFGPVSDKNHDEPSFHRIYSKNSHHILQRIITSAATRGFAQAAPPLIPATASCHEMVSFKMSKHRPKASEIQLNCSVCFDPQPLDNFPVVPITSTCLLVFHRAADESYICKSCINDSIQAQLDTSRPDRINCPLSRADDISGYQKLGESSGI
jgi:hypothetical protein